MPKTFKMFPKWPNFAKSGHTVVSNIKLIENCSVYLGRQCLPRQRNLAKRFDNLKIKNVVSDLVI